MSQAREAILERVRQALKRPTAHSHWQDSSGPKSLADLGCPFPLPKAEIDALADRFKVELEAVHGQFFRAHDATEACKLAKAWFESLSATNLVMIKSAIGTSCLQDLGKPYKLKTLDQIEAGNMRELESCDAVITTAESLIAESGSIMVSSGSTGRAPTVLPTNHLVIVSADRLVASIDQAFGMLRSAYPDRLPSTFSMITGPSRTADIEKILVLGAHGPRKFAVLMVG